MRNRYGRKGQLVALTLLLLILAACGTPAASPTTPPAAPRDPSAKVTDSTLVVYKSPTCSCCKNWNAHVSAYGFPLTVNDVDNLGEIKDRYGVPSALRSCHTAIVEGYVIEGHVPAADVERLLRERPAIVGIAVAGMPAGSPGMDSPGVQAVPYQVMAFDAAGATTVFASH